MGSWNSSWRPQLRLLPINQHWNELPAQVVIWVRNNAFKLALQQYRPFTIYIYLMVALTITGHCLFRVDRPRIINDLLFLFFSMRPVILPLATLLTRQSTRFFAFTSKARCNGRHLWLPLPLEFVRANGRTLTSQPIFLALMRKARFRRRTFHEPNLIRIKADPNYLDRLKWFRRRS